MASGELQEFFAALRSGDPQTAESLLDRIEPSLRRIIRARLQDARVRRVADMSDIYHCSQHPPAECGKRNHF